MSDESFNQPLNPPLVVSGRVEIVDEVEKPFDFENGLAVTLMTTGYLDSETMYFIYLVVMPTGRVYEVSDHLITSAVPLGAVNAAAGGH